MSLLRHGYFQYMHASNLPDGEQGSVAIRRFTVDEASAKVANLREAMHNPLRGRLEAGEYVGLYRRGALWMSDTPDERTDHYAVMYAIRKYQAESVLITGLGIGMVLHAALHEPSVQHITVIEIDSDVIDLVAPTYRKIAADLKKTLSIIEADAIEWVPGFYHLPVKGGKPGRKGPKVYDHFDVIWHDIWQAISLDNLPTMATLHRRYKRMCAPKWQGSWQESYLKDLRRQSQRGGWYS